MSTQIMRLLLIEDSKVRIETFERWLPADMRLVVTSGGGRAMGLIERDRGRTYAGILLDHDLAEQAVSEAEAVINGSHVVRSLIRYIHPDTPVLIHSQNRAGAKMMAAALRESGFEVQVLPMPDLTKPRFDAWLDFVRDMAWPTD